MHCVSDQCTLEDAMHRVSTKCNCKIIHTSYISFPHYSYLQLMKKLLLLLPLLLLLIIKANAQTPTEIHMRAILVDTHNDILSDELITGNDIGKLQTTGNFDLVRAKEGGLDAQVFSIWCGEDYGKGTAFKFANREIDSLYALIARYPDRITLTAIQQSWKKRLNRERWRRSSGLKAAI